MELKNKIVTFLGDSITEGTGVKDVEHNRYDNVIKAEYGLAKVHNMGIGGTRLAHQMHPSERAVHDLCFCGRAYLIPRESNLIVVYGGVNDFIHGDAPFGKIGDTTPETFCGGVFFLMQLLKERYPKSKVAFLTPAHAFYRDIDDLIPSPREEKYPDAKPLIAYVEVIRQTAKQFDIPVLDLYHTLGLDPHDPEIKEKYTADGLHFNDDGHHILAKAVADFLLKL